MPKGDHENMRKIWLLMTKINTRVDKYKGKVVPQVQATHVKIFNFKRWKSDPSWKNGFLVKCQMKRIKRISIIVLGDSFPTVLMVFQNELQFGHNWKRKI